MTEAAREKSSTNLPANIAGMLCYLFTWLGGAVFLAIEKDSKFVRFHAMQSLVTFAGLMVFSYAAHFIPFVGWLLALLVSPLMLVLWVLLMVKAYQGQLYKLPIAGDIAEGQLNKENPPASPPQLPAA